MSWSRTEHIVERVFPSPIARAFYRTRNATAPFDKLTGLLQATEATETFVAAALLGALTRENKLELLDIDGVRLSARPSLGTWGAVIERTLPRAQGDEALSRLPELATLSVGRLVEALRPLHNERNKRGHPWNPTDPAHDLECFQSLLPLFLRVAELLVPLARNHALVASVPMEENAEGVHEAELLLFRGRHLDDIVRRVRIRNPPTPNKICLVSLTSGYSLPMSPIYRAGRPMPAKAEILQQLNEVTATRGEYSAQYFCAVRPGATIESVRVTWRALRPALEKVTEQTRYLAVFEPRRLSAESGPHSLELTARELFGVVHVEQVLAGGMSVLLRATAGDDWDPGWRGALAAEQQQCLASPGPGVQVALKTLADIDPTDHQGERFSRIWKVLTRVRHPAIRRAIDAKQDPRGRLWIALEWLEGRALRDWIDHPSSGRREPNSNVHRGLVRGFVDGFLGRAHAHEVVHPVASAEDIGEVVGDILDALHTFHQNDILHRDVKPANILVRPKGERPRAVIIDLGASRGLGDQVVTQSTSVGTTGYVAPEVRRRENATTASDMYSFGVVLHELLTGRMPRAYPDGDHQYYPDLETVRMQDPAFSRLSGLAEFCLREDVEERCLDGSEATAFLAHRHSSSDAVAKLLVGAGALSLLMVATATDLWLSPMIGVVVGALGAYVILRWIDP